MSLICTGGFYHEVRLHQNFITLSEIFLSLISLLQKMWTEHMLVPSLVLDWYSTALVKQYTASAQKQALMQQFFCYPQSHRDRHAASQAEHESSMQIKVRSSQCSGFLLISFMRWVVIIYSITLRVNLPFPWRLLKQITLLKNKFNKYFKILMHSCACTAALSGDFTGCPQGEIWVCGRSDCVCKGAHRRMKKK